LPGRQANQSDRFFAWRRRWVSFRLEMIVRQKTILPNDLSWIT
jgi:hypothetical protein